MIQSRQDYKYYCEADRRALGVAGTLYDRLTHDIWAFQRSLRRVEYCLNTGRHAVSTIFARLLLRRRSRRLGFSIPPNTFGPGLRIAHYGTIVVNRGARIGADCEIHAGVNIGTQRGFSEAAPTIGDGSYIGPGAKIFGPIVLGDRASVGANAVVTKSWEDPDLTLLGVPAVPVVETKGRSG